MSTPQQARHRRRWSLAIALILPLSLACAQSGSKNPEAPRDITRIRLGTLQSDVLACSGDPCARWFQLAVQHNERISIEVRASAGADLASDADYGVALYNQRFEVLADARSQSQGSHQLSAKLGPGLYYVRVESRIDTNVPLEFTLRAIAGPLSRLAGPRPSPTAEPKAAGAPAPPRAAVNRPQVSPRAVARPATRPPPTPRLPVGEPIAGEVPAKPPMQMQMRQVTLVRSEVIEIEREAGVPIAVLIDAGAPTGVLRGLSGRLLDSGREIGRIEIMDVYPGGSRAKILGELSGEITGDTVAEVFDPLE